LAGARRIRPSIGGSSPFCRRYSKRSGHPAALGRVNLSRAPHCPAAFSLGNEVMETRLDLPFPAPHDVQFYSFLFISLSPRHSPRLASTSFPSSVLSVRLLPTAPRFVAIVLCSPFRRRFAFAATTPRVQSWRELIPGIPVFPGALVPLPKMNFVGEAGRSRSNERGVLRISSTTRARETESFGGGGGGRKGAERHLSCIRWRNFARRDILSAAMEEGRKVSQLACRSLHKLHEEIFVYFSRKHHRLTYRPAWPEQQVLTD